MTVARVGLPGRQRPTRAVTGAGQTSGPAGRPAGPPWKHELAPAYWATYGARSLIFVSLYWSAVSFRTTNAFWSAAGE